jgi:hypothetical protein
VLYYRHAKVDRTGSIKWHHGTLWGGSITENIDQSLSRDLLGYWILKCEDAGLPVVLHVHDDIKTLLPGGRQTDCPECGFRLREICLASNPCKYEYHCPKCNWGLKYYDRPDPHMRLFKAELNELPKQMEIMRSLPTWAKGMPVDVEGKLSETL